MGCLHSCVLRWARGFWEWPNHGEAAQWHTPWSHHSRSSPGGHPAFGYLITILSLLWWASGFPGCWVMAALNSNTNTCMCCWAGPRQGLVKHKSLPVFPCKNFSPMPYSWSLLSHSETAVCFPEEYKEIKRKLGCALLPWWSQRGPQILDAIWKAAALFSENPFCHFCCSAMDKYIPSPQAFVQIAVTGEHCRKQKNRALNS